MNVGQVWRPKKVPPGSIDEFRVLITHISWFGEFMFCDVVRNDGLTYTHMDRDCFLFGELVATYPTWQDAVLADPHFRPANATKPSKTADIIDFSATNPQKTQ